MPWLISCFAGRLVQSNVDFLTHRQVKYIYCFIVYSLFQRKNKTKTKTSQMCTSKIQISRKSDQGFPCAHLYLFIILFFLQIRIKNPSLFFIEIQLVFSIVVDSLLFK